MKNKSTTPGKSKKIFPASEIKTKIKDALFRDLGGKQEHTTHNEHPSKFSWRSRQLQEFDKKFSSNDEDATSLELTTMIKFMYVNQHMASVREIFPDKSLRLTSGLCDRDKILLRARAIMHSVLSPFTEDEWFDECKHSSGSSIGVPYQDTSLESKFTFPLSTTERVRPMMERYFEYDNRTHLAVQKLNCYSDKPKYLHVNGSRATTVEKNDTVRRFICVEPTCNMFLQQGLMHMMYKRMKYYSLDVECLPDEHKSRARISSITSREATIDWSSASDCVSIELLRWLLPPKWFDVVELVRSPTTLISGTEVELNMISTMGNAVTFPLETLVFWTFAHACDLTAKNKGNTLFPEWNELKRCSVFGDDCIVPSEIAPIFIEAMTDVGFIINNEKSYYSTIKFRESCGGDYLAGYSTRPYFIKAPTSERMSSLEPWLYIVLNSLIQKYILYFGELTYLYDKALFRLIFSLMRKYNIRCKVVPPHYPDDSGLKISFDISRFCRHYAIPDLSPIYRSSQGTYTFQYCRFQYKEKARNDAGLRYADIIRKNNKRTSEPNSWFPDSSGASEFSLFRKRRRIGGYVVARGLTCHWHVPDMGPLSG